MTGRVDLYLKPTCRKAVAYLADKNIDVVKHDLAKDPPSRHLLERLVDERHPASRTRSTA